MWEVCLFLCLPSLPSLYSALLLQLPNVATKFQRLRQFHYFLWILAHGFSSCAKDTGDERREREEGERLLFRSSELANVRDKILFLVAFILWFVFVLTFLHPLWAAAATVWSSFHPLTEQLPLGRGSPPAADVWQQRPRVAQLQWCFVPHACVSHRPDDKAVAISKCIMWESCEQQ